MAVYILRDTPRNAITDNAQARLKLMWNMQNIRKLIPINTEVKRNVRMFNYGIYNRLLLNIL